MLEQVRLESLRPRGISVLHCAIGAHIFQHQYYGSKPGLHGTDRPLPRSSVASDVPCSPGPSILCHPLYPSVFLPEHDKPCVQK